MKKILLPLMATVYGLLGINNSTHCQSWTDIFNKDNVSKVVDVVSEVAGVTKRDMTGTWDYTGAAIEFKSDNLLQKAGGAVAATTAESKLDEQLARVGIQPGVTSFAFKADSTFTSTVGKRTMKGTYSYNEEESTVYLKYVGLVGLNAKVSGSSQKMSLLFDADKLLQLLTFIGSKSSSAAIKSISSIADSYDGMLLGMELKK